MIQSLYLQSARSGIRSWLKIPEEEIVDLVLFASTLCNFDPERLLPIWLIIVGSPSSGKTELTSLVRDWRFTWPLPARITAGYFFAARTGSRSALAELDKSDARILQIDDMAGIITGDLHDVGPLYSYLIAVHDGHLQHRTGFVADQLTYGPKAPHERLGFLGSATEKFYTFQERWFQFGSRFMCYYLADQRRAWDAYEHLTSIHDQAKDDPAKRRHAKTQVHALLEHVLENIADFPRVTIDRVDVDRLSAAVTLVQRVLGAGRSADPGIRLHRRVVQMTRMFAFLDGRMRCNNVDVANGIRIILSQLPMHEHRILRFSLEQLSDGPWQFGDLLEYVGATRKIYSGPLEALADVRILRRAGQRGAKGYDFELHPKARALVDVFDPDKAIFPR